MRIKRHYLLAAAAAALFLLPTLLAFAQDDDLMQNVSRAAFENPERPAAVFLHDDHNEKAGIEECYLCHHDDGSNPDPDNSTEGTPCADCHELNPDEGTSLMDTYHTQCIGCHEERGSGPVACGECHVK